MGFDVVCGLVVWLIWEMQKSVDPVGSSAFCVYDSLCYVHTLAKFTAYVDKSLSLFVPLKLSAEFDI